MGAAVGPRVRIGPSSTADVARAHGALGSADVPAGQAALLRQQMYKSAPGAGMGTQVDTQAESQSQIPVGSSRSRTAALSSALPSTQTDTLVDEEEEELDPTGGMELRPLKSQVRLIFGGEWEGIVGTYL